MTYMLVVVCVAWLLLTTPYAVFTLCVPSFSRDRRTAAVQMIVRVLCFLLMYVNHAINFVLYCLTGRKFRAELKVITAIDPVLAFFWRRGVVVSGVCRMNEVNARRARLVPGWVTVFGRVCHLGM